MLAALWAAHFLTAVIADNAALNEGRRISFNRFLLTEGVFEKKKRRDASMILKRIVHDKKCSVDKTRTT